MDKIEAARLVFGEFQRNYEAALARPGAIWALTISEETSERLGLQGAEAKTALGILTQKGLIKLFATGGQYRLTEDGKEVCLHPELLGDYLAPRRQTVTEPSITINADAMHNTQVGGTGNTMNVTYSQVLTELAASVEKDPSEDAQSLGRKIRDIAKHPLVVGLALAAAKIGLDQLGK